jgi:hypothetical protein
MPRVQAQELNKLPALQAQRVSTALYPCPLLAPPLTGLGPLPQSPPVPSAVDRHTPRLHAKSRTRNGVRFNFCGDSPRRLPAAPRVTGSNAKKRSSHHRDQPESREQGSPHIPYLGCRIGSAFSPGPVALKNRRLYGEPMASVRHFQVTFDCAEPERVARFWCEVLGYVVPPPPEGFATWDDFESSFSPEDQGSSFACIDPSGVGRDCSSNAFPKARSSRTDCILTCESAPGS